MKKILPLEVLFVLLLAGVMALLLWKKEPDDLPLTDLEQAVLSSCTLTGMEKAGDMRLKRAFGLNAADYDSYIYYAPDNTMSVNELLVVKLPDEARADEVLAAAEARIETQKKNFDGYGTDQTALLQDARVLQEGPYVIFAVGQDAGRWVDVIREKLGIRAFPFPLPWEDAATISDARGGALWSSAA
ncbi:MAG: DUF4358 domain-containing protein [Lachnospiraceae bacterium]|nr:DUF4358 domain-containing protein [Lachnospiraceae bacterium]